LRGADGLRPEHHNGREEVHVNNELTQREESMTTIKAIRLASVVTAINVLVASGFSIAAIIRPQYLVPAESVPTEASLLLAMYAAAPRIPLALFVLGAIYKQATPALLILGALAGPMLRWNFLQAGRWRVFADGEADVIKGGFFFIPQNDPYNLFVRGGAGASYRIHDTYWLEVACRWGRTLGGLNGMNQYSSWTGVGASLALRHTFGNPFARKRA
jgi:hypothetical protein